MTRAEAYTDGANMPHAEFKHAGSAVVLLYYPAADVEPLVWEWAYYIGNQSNQVAELYAIEMAVTLQERVDPAAKLHVFTDSQYCEGLFTWLPPLERWRYKAKSNKEIVTRIRERLRVFTDGFEIEWLRGHNNHRFNERADVLAVWAKESRGQWSASYRLNAGFPPLPQAVAAGV